MQDLERINKHNYQLFTLSIRKFIELDMDYQNLIDANSNLNDFIQCINFMNDYKKKAYYIEYLLALTLSTNNKKNLEKIEDSIDIIDLILSQYIKNKIKNMIWQIY